MNFKDLETKALALFDTLANEIAANPQAQTVVSDLKQTITDGKVAAVSATKPEIIALVTEKLTPIIGADEAAAAAQLAADAIDQKIEAL